MFLRCRPGSFLQTDPVGYEDDLNLYAYVRNDPMNVADPSGEQGRHEDDTQAARSEASRQEAIESLPIPQGPQFQPQPEVEAQEPREFDVAREAVSAIAGRAATVATSETGPLSLVIGESVSMATGVAYDAGEVVLEEGVEVANEVGGDFHTFATQGPPDVPHPEWDQMRERER